MPRAAGFEPGGEAAGGLVSIINNVKTGLATSKTGLANFNFEVATSKNALATSDVKTSPWDVETLKIDSVQARCTRMRKSVGMAAKCFSQESRGLRSWMLTFTYRGVDDWKPSHIRDALRHFRQWLRRVHGFKLRCIWVMELQKRGAPHYHVVCWLPSSIHRRDLKFDALGWWPHGMTNAMLAVAPVRYVMKYVSKFDSTSTFPKHARLHGTSGLDPDSRGVCRWIHYPSFIKSRASVSDRWTRAKGGGWLAPDGQRWASEWGLSAVSRTYTRVMRLHKHPPGPIAQPCGPFSWNPHLTHSEVTPASPLVTLRLLKAALLSHTDALEPNVVAGLIQMVNSGDLSAVSPQSLAHILALCSYPHVEFQNHA